MWIPRRTRASVAMLSAVSLSALPALALPTWTSSALSWLTGLQSPQEIVHGIEQIIQHDAEWLSRKFAQQDGTVFEFVQHSSPALSEHTLRVNTKSPSLCEENPYVKQYSGYLDVSTGRHLFFWFFEARESPETAPTVLWLNGGPGCSSSTGLLFELGPCSISRNDTSSPVYTTPNPHSWTNHANIIFLDQPTNVGFSYSSDSSTVLTSQDAAKDVWAFLQLFFTRFEEYYYVNGDKSQFKSFHVAAESYGGHYGPNIVNVIHERNQDYTSPASGLVHINLESLILANGLTDPYLQFASIPEYMCKGPFALWDDNGPECASLRSKVPTCQRLVKGCYESGSRFSCVPAALYCNAQLMGPVANSGRNPYDLRKPCDRETDGGLCYSQMNWIDEWMNKPDVKQELGVDPKRQFQSCNMNVNQGFLFKGDGMHDSALLLPPLLSDEEANFRLLVYAGNADGMCNYMGNFDWMFGLEGHPFSDAFRDGPLRKWSAEVTEEGRVTKKWGGEVKSAGGKKGSAGRYTFATVYDAGHMVPYDQPEAAELLFKSWINNEALPEA